MAPRVKGKAGEGEHAKTPNQGNAPNTQAQEPKRVQPWAPWLVGGVMLWGLATGATGCAPPASPPSQVSSTPPLKSEQILTSVQSSTAQPEFASRMAEARAEVNDSVAYIQANLVSTISSKMQEFDPNFSFSPEEKQSLNDQLKALLAPSNIILVYEPTSPRAGRVSESGIIQLNIAKESLSTPLHEALDAISKNCPSRALAEAGSELLTQLFLSRDPQLLDENPYAAYPLQTFSLFFLFEAKIVTPEAFWKAYRAQLNGDTAEFYAQINSFSPGLGEKLFPLNSSFSDFLASNDSQALRELLTVAESKGIDVGEIIAKARLLKIDVDINWQGR